MNKKETGFEKEICQVASELRIAAGGPNSEGGPPRWSMLCLRIKGVIKAATECLLWILPYLGYELEHRSNYIETEMAGYREATSI